MQGSRREEKDAADAAAEERRQHPRFFDEVKIRFRDLGGTVDARWGRARDLSLGGTCLLSDSDTEVGCHLALEIHLERAAPPMLALARVLRCESAEGEFHSGLEFLWVGEEAHDSLVEFTEYCRDRLNRPV
jgi:hypothetical protein